MSLLGRLLGGKVSEVDATEAKRRQDAGALVVDVRRPDEWSEGHVAGAIHIPLDQLAARLHELPADREAAVRLPWRQPQPHGGQTGSACRPH